MTTAKIKVGFWGDKYGPDPYDLIKEKHESGELKRRSLGLNNLEVEIMTTEKMPDKFYLSRWPHCHFYVDRENEDDEKGYRAEPVEALLKQARDVLNSANNTYLGNEYIYTLKPDDVENTITAIDKFLGEK